jgi:large subunit ribosomal protein L24e
MVIKTEVCAFTEYRIYPGHGMRAIRRDGLVMYFINSKAKRLYKQSIKPAKLTWTTAWRRLHKKGTKEDNNRARKRRIVRAPRAYVGLTAADIEKKKKELPEIRKKSSETAAAELAARQKKKEEKAKADKIKATQQPKNVPQVSKGGAHVSKNR